MDNKKNELEIEGLLDFIHTELLNVKSLYRDYKLLYSKKTQVEFINYVAPHFFGTYQMLLVDSIILKICCLTDNKQTGNFQNASIAKLIDLISLEDKLDGKKLNIKNLNSLFKELNLSVEKIKKYRKKNLAHFDYEQIKKPLDLKIQQIDIEVSLKILLKIITLVYLQYFSRCISKSSIPARGGVESLIKYLKNGHKFSEGIFKELISNRINDVLFNKYSKPKFEIYKKFT